MSEQDFSDIVDVLEACAARIAALEAKQVGDHVQGLLDTIHLLTLAKQEWVDRAKAAEAKVAELEKYADLLNGMLSERDSVLSCIPDCEQHGACLPHYEQWIKSHLPKGAPAPTGTQEYVSPGGAVWNVPEPKPWPVGEPMVDEL